MVPGRVVFLKAIFPVGKSIEYERLTQDSNCLTFRLCKQIKSNQIKSNHFIGLKIQQQDCHQAHLTFTI